MHWFIDGYNLLFSAIYSEAPLQDQREKIIVFLNEQIRFLKIPVSVVFDSDKQPTPLSRTQFDALEIIFTPESQTADDFILEQIEKSKHPRAEMVVTSDRDLARKARSLGAKTLSINEFVPWLKSRVRKKQFRQQQPTKILPPLPPPPPNTPAKRPKNPHKDFDYYLNAFVKEAASSKETLPSASTPIKRKKPQEKQKPPESPLSEIKRLLHIFEKRLADKDNDD